MWIIGVFLWSFKVLSTFLSSNQMDRDKPSSWGQKLGPSIVNRRQWADPNLQLSLPKQNSRRQRQHPVAVWDTLSISGYRSSHTFTHSTPWEVGYRSLRLLFCLCQLLRANKETLASCSWWLRPPSLYDLTWNIYDEVLREKPLYYITYVSKYCTEI